MSSIQDRLQQLLDGDIDAADIADDPTLVSLADRLYGIKIAAVQPVKARDAKDLLATSGAVTEVAPPTNMLIEVIAPEAGINAGVLFLFPTWRLICRQCLWPKRAHCVLSWRPDSAWFWPIYLVYFPESSEVFANPERAEDLNKTDSTS